MVIRFPERCMKPYEMVLTCDDSLFITKKGNCIPVKSQKKCNWITDTFSKKRLLTGVQCKYKE